MEPSAEDIALERRQYIDMLQQELTLDKDTAKPQKVELNTTLVMEEQTIHLSRNAYYFADQPVLEPIIDALNAKVRVEEVDYENQLATVAFLDDPSCKLTLECDTILSQEYLCDEDNASPRTRITEHLTPLMGDFARVLGEAVAKS